MRPVELLIQPSPLAFSVMPFGSIPEPLANGVYHSTLMAAWILGPKREAIQMDKKASDESFIEKWRLRIQCKYIVTRLGRKNNFHQSAKAAVELESSVIFYEWKQFAVVA